MIRRSDLFRRRASVCGLVVAVSLLALLTACQGAVVGDWRMVRATPSREVFCLDQVEFRSDGRFAANCTLDGRTAREIGTFSFNGFKLTLRPAAGGQREYNATLRLGRLEISNGAYKVVLEKGKAEPAVSRRDEPAPRAGVAGASDENVILPQQPAVP